MTLKGMYHKFVNWQINRLTQGTVAEINDGVTSAESIKKVCREIISEGSVLLKNDNEVLPLKNNKFALFGRCQVNTFYVGYGSGGDVKPPYKVSILEGLQNQGANLDEETVKLYKKWCEKHPPEEGFWGHWPMYYPEMKLKDDFVKGASKRSEIAVVIIGRAAGEDRENKAEKGSWYLTKEEELMLSLTRKHFNKLVVIINAGSIMDQAGIESYNPDSVMYVWQGGQETGNGVADVLLGKTSPSGRLTDTIAKIEDYPSTPYFGNKEYNNYVEDIFVGYRYFNTFAKDKIIYPFGYGLSYSKFNLKNISTNKKSDTEIEVNFTVENAGNLSAKHIVQIYQRNALGKLGKPELELASYVKTKELKTGDAQEFTLLIDLAKLSSFDDLGVTEFKNSFVLEEGEYKIYIGNNINEISEVYSLTLDKTICTKKAVEALAPVRPYKRMVNKNGISFEDTPTQTIDLRERILNNLPKEIKETKKGPFKLDDVISKKIALDEFVSQLTVEELEAITRGSLHSMNSPFGPKGNAGTLGANMDSLFEKGIPALSTNDGPSGARLQVHSTLLPNAVSIASSFNDELVENLTYEFGIEVRDRKSHILLAPGMNIHRNPLCGRNFEYFSEDPILTGKIASAYVRGVQKSGTSATPKHLACNNQETNRSGNDSIVSQRALREIYLKGFEICVKESKPDVIMASYNIVNGDWAHYNYDLATTILREDWGFDGLVITDWWMRDDKSTLFKEVENQAFRVRAQVDVFMPGAPNHGKFKGQSDGSILRSLSSDDGLTKAELQRSAKNVLNLCIKHYKN